MRPLYLIGVTLLLGLLLAACSNESVDVTVTPPVVQATATTEPTATPLPPATEAPPATPTSAETVTETDPDAGAEEPTSTPLPTPAPTSTPVPVALAQSIALEPIADGFTRPVYLTHAGDSRLFIVEQKGVITILDNGAQSVFLDIDERVNDGANEQGLLSLAFHPAYAENGRFFVYYTDGSGASVISEFSVSDNPNVALPDSERQLMRVGQPYSNHNGGQIVFGPDGYLYIGFGDGGSQGDPQGNGQNLATLLGAIARVDVDAGEFYGVPADNPFVADDAARNEIWSYGFRNPWRFSFDLMTGDMYIADVGQNQWEEISFEPEASSGGQNYGWVVREGAHCYGADTCNSDGLVDPVIEYAHADGGCSVTGGYVYRGAAQPALWGNYFYVDYCFGDIHAAVQGESGWQTQIVLPTEMTIASFGEDVDGELYVLDHVGGGVYRLVTGS